MRILSGVVSGRLQVVCAALLLLAAARLAEAAGAPTPVVTSVRVALH